MSTNANTEYESSEGTYIPSSIAPDEAEEESRECLRTKPLPPLPVPETWYVKAWSAIRKSFTDWWMEELLALLVSIGTFSAIVIILGCYGNHQLPRLPFNMSLNFLISILAAVSKSTLLVAVASAIGQCRWLWMSERRRPLQDLQVYDEASRSPLGASKLLLSRKGLSWASLGSLVTILLLIFDPFVQGLINIAERTVYHEDPDATLKAAKGYFRDQEDINDMGYNFAKAIANSGFTQVVLPELQPHCPTGNCTWPGFTSSGFCSDCQDTTQSLRRSSTRQNVPNTLSNESSIVYRYTFPDWNGQTLLTSGLPFDSPNNGSFSVEYNQSIEMTTGPQFLAVPFRLNHSQEPTGLGGTIIHSVVAMHAFLRFAVNYEDPGRVLKADLCTLNLCTHERDVSVTTNRLSSSIQTTYHKMSEKEKLVRQAFEYTMFSTLSGRLMVIARPGGDVTISELQSPVLYAYNASTNISLTMQNVATSMTNFIREQSNVTITGKAGFNEAYVRIAWSWITFPASLLILGTSFLFITMFETKRKGTRVWKTSELPLLFHSVEALDLVPGDVDEVGEMEHRASKVMVRMTPVKCGGWMLQRQRGPPPKSE